MHSNALWDQQPLVNIIFIKNLWDQQPSWQHHGYVWRPCLGQNDLKLCSRSKIGAQRGHQVVILKMICFLYWTASTATLVKCYRLDGHVICQTECRTHVGSFVWSILQIHETLKWDLQYEKAMMTSRLDRPATLKLRHVCLNLNDKNDLDPMHNAGTRQIS